MNRFEENNEHAADLGAEALAAKALADVREGLRRAGELHHRRWRELLGRRLDKLLQSEPDTEECLSHPDPKLREGALALMAHHWEPRHALKDVYLNIALFDPNSGVKAAAVSCLGRLYRGT